MDLLGIHTAGWGVQRQAPWGMVVRRHSLCYPAVLGLLCSLLSSGCSSFMTRSATRTLATVLETGLPAYARETDLTLAEPALATTLKLLEALLETEPTNPTLLAQAAQGFGSYTYAFVEAQIAATPNHNAPQTVGHRQRAQRLYQRGMQYGWRRLSLYHPAWSQGTRMGLEVLTERLQQLDTSAVPALFWTAFCWGNWLNLNRAELDTIAALPRLATLLKRLVELDAGYLYGAPHLLQAVHYASRSPLLGGEPQRAQYHFAQARAFSQQRLLLVPLLEAQYYAVQIQDRVLFVSRLEEVMQAPDTLLPEQAFLNTVARQRAALLLRRIDELFP